MDKTGKMQSTHNMYKKSDMMPTVHKQYPLACQDFEDWFDHEYIMEHPPPASFFWFAPFEMQLGVLLEWSRKRLIELEIKIPTWKYTKSRVWVLNVFEIINKRLEYEDNNDDGTDSGV